jgi:hypothetical protein
MNSKISRKYMGLNGSSWNSKKQLFDNADESIYHWWWQFLRLSPILWYANYKNATIKDPVLNKVYAHTGGLPSHSFKAWWSQHGYAAFAEPSDEVLVKAVSAAEALSSSPKDVVLVEVPLTLNKREIKSQFVQLLNKVHRGRNYDVEAFSKASLKLYTHKFNLTTIERQYWVLLYKLIYPKTPLWVIGDRLRLAPHLDVRHIDRKTVERRSEAMFIHLQSHTWRYHAHAEYLLHNLIKGSFPNYTKPSPEAEVDLFLDKQNEEFRALTKVDSEGSSPWQKWIKRHYQEQLHQKIISINNFGTLYRDSPSFNANFKKFIRGKLEM